MDHKIDIQTERLTLRTLRRTDISALAKLLNDYEVSRWLTVVPYPYSEADGHEFLDFLAKADQLEALAIIAPEGIIGVVGIGSSLGYWLGRAHHGKGYMREAAGALVDYYFSRRDVDQLNSGYFTNNGASAAVLGKLGFTPNGAEQVNARAQGIDVTLKKVILTRAEWARRAAIVTTKRLFLRPLCTADIPRLADIGGRPEIARMLATLHAPWQSEQVGAWIEKSRWQGRPGFRLGLCLADGELIGSVGLGGTPASCGYFLHPEYWGQGYATEAMSGLLGMVFDRFDIAEIETDHFDDNPASARVLEKLGFVHVGPTMGASVAREAPAPGQLWRLSRAEFAASHAS